MRPLSELSLEELWELFPIILREYNPDYDQWFEEQSTELAEVWGTEAVRVSHIGSTAVQGLVAKPTVDILLEVADEVAPGDVVSRLETLGWLQMSGTLEEPLNLSFNKGYTPQGFAEKVWHLHVRRAGDPDELYFRDYLRDHASARDEYAALKRALRECCERDRDGYTDAKGPLVARMTAAARQEYDPRYSLRS